MYFPKNVFIVSFFVSLILLQTPLKAQTLPGFDARYTAEVKIQVGQFYVQKAVAQAILNNARRVSLTKQRANEGSIATSIAYVIADELESKLPNGENFYLMVKMHDEIPKFLLSGQTEKSNPYDSMARQLKFLNAAAEKKVSHYINTRVIL